jgi:hypothetical protein
MFIAALAFEAIVSIVAMAWVIRDARSRGKSGFLVALMMLVFQIPGLLL